MEHCKDQANLQGTLIGLSLAVGAASSVLAGTAQSALPMREGIYVREGAPCARPPFAAIFTFDGQSLSGPHSEQCNSTIVSHHARTYVVKTRCGALGDKTPTTPYTETVTLRVLSPTRVFRRRGGDAAVYRLCAPDEGAK